MFQLEYFWRLNQGFFFVLFRFDFLIYQSRKNSKNGNLMEKAVGLFLWRYLNNFGDFPMELKREFSQRKVKGI